MYQRDRSTERTLRSYGASEISCRQRSINISSLRDCFKEESAQTSLLKTREVANLQCRECAQRKAETGYPL
jgi:hypothetical protein